MNYMSQMIHMLTLVAVNIGPMPYQSSMYPSQLIFHGNHYVIPSINLILQLQ